MNSPLSEKNLVVVLFVLVLIIFSLAQEDSKKMDQFYGKGFPADTNTFTTLLDAQVNVPENNSTEIKVILPAR